MSLLLKLTMGDGGKLYVQVMKVNTKNYMYKGCSSYSVLTVVYSREIRYSSHSPSRIYASG